LLSELTNDNIIKLKLCDFTFARKLKDGEYAASFLGTKGYIAPEIDSNNYTSVADLYSVGIIFGEMISLSKITSPSKEALNLRNRLVEKDPSKRINFRDFDIHRYFKNHSQKFELMREVEKLREDLEKLKKQNELLVNVIFNEDIEKGIVSKEEILEQKTKKSKK